MPPMIRILRSSDVPGPRRGHLSPFRAALSALLLSCAPGLLTACGDDDSLPDRCKLVVWYRPVQLAQQLALPLVPADAEHAVLVGSYDNWTEETPFERYKTDSDADWRRAVLELPPGNYQYALRIGDELFADPNNQLYQQLDIEQLRKLVQPING